MTTPAETKSDVHLTRCLDEAPTICPMCSLYEREALDRARSQLEAISFAREMYDENVGLRAEIAKLEAQLAAVSR